MRWRRLRPGKRDMSDATNSEVGRVSRVTVRSDVGRRSRGTIQRMRSLFCCGSPGVWARDGGWRLPETAQQILSSGAY
jgi:hypothetical protein